jgi:hypothetical protein
MWSGDDLVIAMDRLCAANLVPGVKLRYGKSE